MLQFRVNYTLKDEILQLNYGDTGTITFDGTVLDEGNVQLTIQEDNLDVDISSFTWTFEEDQQGIILELAGTQEEAGTEGTAEEPAPAEGSTENPE